MNGKRTILIHCFNDKLGYFGKAIGKMKCGKYCILQI